MKEKYRLSSYLVVTELLDETEKDPSRIVFATRSGISLLIRDSIFQALKRGDFEQVDSKYLISLMGREVIVPADENEFEEILARNIRGTRETRTMEVTIQPTANCQLGCGYCGQVHSKKNVDPAVSRKITDRILGNLSKRPYEELTVEWFGAEPLMAFSEIIRMSERLRGHCALHGVKYKARMITNGMSLKPAVFLQLLEQQVYHYQITLDGIGETHDVMRISKEGKKTFEIIFKNLLEVTSLPEYMNSRCSITIRMNISGNSARTVTRLIDHMASHGLERRRVSIDFAPIFDWGGNGAAATGLSKEEFSTREIEWMLYALEKGFDIGRVIPTRKNGPCMVVKEHAEVYDASGNIFPCYEFPYTPAYDGPEYKIGHVDTVDRERNDDAVTRNWLSDVRTDISPCKSCELFPVCGGGCPKQWYNKEVACPQYKDNIEDRLIMDYLIRKDGYLKRYLGSPADTDWQGEESALRE